MGQPYTWNVDIWSLGVTLFEMMMLRHAFAGTDNQQVLRAIVNCKHEPINDGYSHSLISLLKEMLVVRASQRPTAIQLVDTVYFADVLSLGMLSPDALRHRPGGAYCNIDATLGAAEQEGMDVSVNVDVAMPVQHAKLSEEEINVCNHLLQPRKQEQLHANSQ